MKKVKNKKRHVLIRCIMDYYKAHTIALLISAICTFISALGPIVAPLMIQRVTNLIATAIEQGSFASVSKDFYEALAIMISAYVISLAGGFTYSQLTARYAQKYMHELRCRLFEHMQDLPIKYFDTHDKGEIMSTFTNDVDTIRQLLAQSITTVLICSVTFISVFVIMLLSSIYLTIIVILGTIAMILVTKFVGGKSAKNFTAQQHVLAKEEGYVEEMMNGLKVIKSFTHEEECKKEFEQHVTELQKVSTDAHKFANILMPILGNIGNFLYILVAVVATILFIFEVPELTITGYHPNSYISIGIIVSFLPMVRQFTNNVSEVSNQINPIAMAIG